MTHEVQGRFGGEASLRFFNFLFIFFNGNVNEFDLQTVNYRATQTHFHMKGCPPAVVLKEKLEKGLSDSSLLSLEDAS